jgi:hypothetical protein
MFSREEIETFKLLASQCAAAFGQMSLQAQVEEVFEGREANAKPATPFRHEALDTYALGEGGSAAPLRVSPKWAAYVYHLLVVVIASFLGYSMVGNIDEYATGPAIVRIDGRSDLTATSSAIVASVQVQPSRGSASRRSSCSSGSTTLRSRPSSIGSRRSSTSS